MRIVDPKTLALFRGRGLCGYCGRFNCVREAAHVSARGMGSGKRVDLAINLIALGGVWGCACHDKSHNGKEPTQEQLLAKVAAREGVSVDQIKECLKNIRNLPKGSSREAWESLIPKRKNVDNA